MFKTKSLLTKATSPSCWSVVLPGQGNPAGIHEAAPPRTEPRSRAQQLQPPAHPCLPDPSPAADPGPARRRGPLCRPLPARLAGCRGDTHTPPPKKKPQPNNTKNRRAGSAGRGCEGDAPHLWKQTPRRRGGGGGGAGTPAEPRRALPSSGRAGGGLRGAAGGRGFPCRRRPLRLPPCQPLFWARPRSLPKLFKSPGHVDEHQLAWGRARRPPCPPCPPCPLPPTPPGQTLPRPGSWPLGPGGQISPVGLAGAVGAPAWRGGEGLGGLQGP